MLQTIIDENSEASEIQPLNNVSYSSEDFRLFTETVCEEVKLDSLKKFIERNDYNPFSIKELIRSLSNGIKMHPYTEISEGAQIYHKQLFEVMYVKRLIELPLMINGDPDITPVVKWRFRIAK
jgi:hypothetical protein